MKRCLILLAGLSFFPSYSHAKRFSTLTPKFASVSSVRQNASATQGSLGISLVNLSSVKQTVKIKTLDEEISTFVRVQNPSGITGWDTVTYGGAHQSTTYKPTSIEVTVELNPNESKTVALDGVQCNWKTSGCFCYRSSSYPGHSNDFITAGNSPATAVNFIYDSSITYSFRFLLEIEEDRGAILASAGVWLGFSDVVAPNGPARGVWSMDFNGGKPF